MFWLLCAYLMLAARLTILASAGGSRQHGQLYFCIINMWSGFVKPS